MQPESNKKEKRKAPVRFHYAWVIAFASLLVSGAGVGIFNSCTGVFVKPVCDALGFSRGQFSLYSSISTLVCVLLMPVFGSLFRRYGFRRIAITGAALCGLTLIGFSISSQLWHFYLLALLSGLFINGVGIMAVGILVNRWFADKRGIATGVAYSGSGLLAAILIPITNRFIETNGWAWSYRFLGCVSLFILLPIILFVIRDKPEDMGLKPYGANSGDTQTVTAASGGLSRKEALHSSVFWLLIAAVLGIAVCQAGPHVHTVSFLSDIGYSSTYASTVSSVYMFLLTASKVLMGLLFDRLGSLKGSMLIGGCCILFPVVALAASNPAAPWLYICALAIASSGSTILGTMLTTNYFGSHDFARIYSIVSMSTYAGVTISSPMLGTIYDMTGSYTLAWFLIIGLGAVVCVCLFAAYGKSKKLKARFEAIQGQNG